MYQTWKSVQKNGTPRRKPRKSGGSPMGVSAPPTFETQKMKKTMWYGLIRPALSRMYGRISSIDAPVVPMRFEITAPMKRSVALMRGLPA